jgi:hypothetical protein
VVVRKKGCWAIPEEDLLVRIREVRRQRHGGGWVVFDVSVAEVVDVGGLWR